MPEAVAGEAVLLRGHKFVPFPDKPEVENTRPGVAGRNQFNFFVISAVTVG
jgi:hypothetical protein